MRNPPKKPDHVAVGFGFKGSWLAARAVPPARLIEAAGLRDVRPIGWTDGIAAAYRGARFVTPDIDGWTLLVSQSLPSPQGPEPDEAIALVRRLSRELGAEVQLFATHRVSEYHAWLRAIGGELVRGYASCEGVLLDVGGRSPEEVALGFEYAVDGDEPWDTEEAEEEDDDDEDAEDGRTRVGEGVVMDIADRWSVAPVTLEGRVFESGGWIGS